MMAALSKPTTFSQPVDAIRHEPRPPSPDQRCLPDRRMISGTATVGVERMICARPHAFAAQAIQHVPQGDGDRSRDVDDNSCSHDESLNRFGRLGIVRMNRTTSWIRT